MILRVTHYGEPILRKVGKVIKKFDKSLSQLASDMIETMYDREGIGLAAQQIDRALQLCVIDVCPPESINIPFDYLLDGRKPPLKLVMPMVLVNPKITIINQINETYEEGCLSFPGIIGEVKRPTKVRCNFQDIKGEHHEIEADGLLGRCILHEIDHLNGKLFIDHMERKDLIKNERKVREIKQMSRNFLKSFRK